MNHWLAKTEPDEFSWDDHLNAPGRTCQWEGVRNAQAQKFIQQMARGDQVMIYHSGKQRQVMGIAKVARTAYPDPTDPAGKALMVDLKAVEALPAPVTLKTIKQQPELAELKLVKQPRLSVMPIPDDAWQRIIELSQQTD